MPYRHFDPAETMRVLRCDPSETMMLALHLLDQCHQACDGLEMAVVCGEWRGVAAIANRIRNGCAVLCAQHAGDLARELEVKAMGQSLQAGDLQRMSDCLRALAIDLLTFVTEVRSAEVPALALAA